MGGSSSRVRPDDGDAPDQRGTTLGRLLSSSPSVRRSLTRLSSAAATASRNPLLPAAPSIYVEFQLGDCRLPRVPAGGGAGMEKTHGKHDKGRRVGATVGTLVMRRPVRVGSCVDVVAGTMTGTTTNVGAVKVDQVEVEAGSGVVRSVLADGLRAVLERHAPAGTAASVCTVPLRLCSVRPDTASGGAAELRGTVRLKQTETVDKRTVPAEEYEVAWEADDEAAYFSADEWGLLHGAALGTFTPSSPASTSGGAARSGVSPDAAETTVIRIDFVRARVRGVVVGTRLAFLSKGQLWRCGTVQQLLDGQATIRVDNCGATETVACADMAPEWAPATESTVAVRKMDAVRAPETKASSPEAKARANLVVVRHKERALVDGASADLVPDLNDVNFAHPALDDVWCVRHARAELERACILLDILHRRRQRGTKVPASTVAERLRPYVDRARDILQGDPDVGGDPDPAHEAPKSSGSPADARAAVLKMLALAGESLAPVAECATSGPDSAVVEAPGAEVHVRDACAALGDVTCTCERLSASTFQARLVDFCRTIVTDPSRNMVRLHVRVRLLPPCPRVRSRVARGWCRVGAAPTPRPNVVRTHTTTSRSPTSPFPPLLPCARRAAASGRRWRTPSRASKCRF